jgi:hypothetical protein
LHGIINLQPVDKKEEERDALIIIPRILQGRNFLILEEISITIM